MPPADPMPSIVLITVDSWRRDTLGHMSALGKAAGEWLRGTAVCHGASTNGALAALLASAYSSNCYSKRDGLRPGLETLPALLRAQGYATCAILGHNPRLRKWASHFGAFWNHAVPGQAVEGRPTQRPLRRAAGRLCRFLALRPPVRADEVLARGAEWFGETPGPKFLWMHLMDAHRPYHPGLRQARKVGLLRSYRALTAYELQPPAHDGLSRSARRQVRRLYEACVANVDAALARWLHAFQGCGGLVIVGDHGEEFDHGVLRHARLYEECVTVPLCSRWDATPPAAFRTDAIRQIDLAPAIMDWLELDVPEQWQGSADGAADMSLLVNASRELGEVYVGMRTSRWKYIRTYRQRTMSLHAEELYDLDHDPAERYNLAGETRYEPTRAGLEQALAQQLDECGIPLEQAAASGHPAELAGSGLSVA